MRSDWLVPDGLPAQVGALMTTRAGGVSGPPYASLNIGDAVGDAPELVTHNRALLARAIGARPVYLRQRHGVQVVRLTGAEDPATPPEADGSFTTEPGVACAIQVADCLPALFASPEGRVVGAAHAGWRGLAGGVLEATLAAVCEADGCSPRDVSSWLGPCIGPRRFEVGADVVQAFGDGPRFAPAAPVDGQPKWLADLAGLARDRLTSTGVAKIAGGRWCTVEDASRFFSFRRDRVTGRLVALIWRR